MQPPKALSNASQRNLIAVVRRLIKRAEYFFSFYGLHDNACGDSALVAMR